jgi:KDO2-lipid IV(A) lauroyltransferase
VTATVLQRLVASSFAASSTVLSALPRRLTLGAARLAGLSAYLVLPGRRRVAHENLEAALGSELSPAARRRIARASFAQAAAMAADLLTLPRVARDPRRYCEVSDESLALLRGALARGRGVVLLAGHFGYFESMGILLGHEGIPLSFVAKPFENPALDGAVNARRGATGNGVIHKGGAKARASAELRQGRCVAIVVDQHVSAGDRLWVPFFGLPASTTRSLGVLAVETGAPVVPIHSYPLPGGRCRCEFGPVLDAPRTGDDAADGEALVRAAIAEMEKATRRMPEAWLWLHRRWKVRPTGWQGPFPAHAITEAAERQKRDAARQARLAAAEASGGAGE